MANSDDRYEMLRDRELSKLSWVVNFTTKPVAQHDSRDRQGTGDGFLKKASGFCFLFVVKRVAARHPKLVVLYQNLRGPAQPLLSPVLSLTSSPEQRRGAKGRRRKRAVPTHLAGWLTNLRDSLGDSRSVSPCTFPRTSAC